MAVDTILWVIIGVGVAWVWLGCHMTANTAKSGNIHRERFRH